MPHISPCAAYNGRRRPHSLKNDEELPYECPLIRDDIHLSEAFVKATYTVWSHLLRDPLIYDLVEMDSAARDIDDNLQR